MREYKSCKAAVMGIDDRTVTGLFCTHGNIDDGDGWTSRDRSHPGLFGDFKVGPRDRVVFLWNHDSRSRPTASIDDIFEVAAADLPPAVKLYAPEATGGVAVKRTYLDTPAGNEVLAGLRAGAIKEMSYAYDPVRWDLEKPAEGSRDLPIRNLYEATLWDISDVNHGMNPATSADGSKGLAVVAHGDQVQASVAAYIARIQELNARRAKEGRVFSQANYNALKALADELEEAIASLRDLLAQGEPKRATDARQLLLMSERTLAYLNGVKQ